MDSLRYWVLEMHVDGFRFDLAATLARELHDVDRLSAFFDLIQQDPVVSQVKLIAEPWDVGEGGYQVGNFPPLWSEWNGKYRDSRARLLARHRSDARRSSATASPAAPISTRAPARRPYASINFITAHDGFTLRDLVSYNDKHNEANGEDNRDGENHNRSWNCGAEGPTDDPDDHRAARTASSATSWRRCSCRRACRCCCGGDEIGRTQQRQQQRLLPGQRDLLVRLGARRPDAARSSPRDLIELRQRAPGVLPPPLVPGPRRSAAAEVSDIGWFTPGGDRDVRRGLAGRLRQVARRVPQRQRASRRSDERGERVVDDSFYVMFNAHHEPVEFALPEAKWGERWTVMLDTSEPTDHWTRTRRAASWAPASDVHGAALVARAAAPAGPDSRGDRGVTSGDRARRS